MNINFFNIETTTYITLETFLINSCFLTLFLTTVYYWISFIFFSKKDYPNFGFYGVVTANLLIFTQLCLRWFESGHFPLSNLYDSLLFLAWGLLFIFIILEKKQT